MTGEELSDFLDTLTALQLRNAAAYLLGYSPEGFAGAVGMDINQVPEVLG